jgi:hypothetical protein
MLLVDPVFCVLYCTFSRQFDVMQLAPPSGMLGPASTTLPSAPLDPLLLPLLEPLLLPPPDPLLLPLPELPLPPLLDPPPDPLLLPLLDPLPPLDPLLPVSALDVFRGSPRSAQATPRHVVAASRAKVGPT